MNIIYPSILDEIRDAVHEAKANNRRIEAVELNWSEAREFRIAIAKLGYGWGAADHEDAVTYMGVRVRLSPEAKSLIRLGTRDPWA